MDEITFRAAWADYEAYLRSQRMSASYLKSLSYTYRSFVAFIGTADAPLANINTLLLRRWMTSDQFAAVASSTVQLRAKHIRAFMTWAYDEELTATNQVERLKLPKATKRPTPLLTDSEIRQLVEEVAFSNHPTRDTALVLTMLCTGARAAEVSGLTWDDVMIETILEPDGSERKRGVIRILGKGGKHRSLLVEHMAAVALEKWGRRGRIGRVFPIGPGAIGSLLARVSARAGMAHAAPHMLRVAFATAFARAHRDEWRVLQDRMGHATMGQTEHYARRSDMLLELPGPGVLETVGIQA